MIFLFICNEIPDKSIREDKTFESKGEISDRILYVFEGCNWGVGDYIVINGVETWLMNFTITDTMVNVNEILDGKYPDKIDNYYYPIGRITMLSKINILYDDANFLIKLKKIKYKYI